MPGIFGCIDRKDERIPQELADSILSSLTHENFYSHNLVLDPCLLGTVGLQDNSHNLAQDKERCLVGVIAGNPYTNSMRPCSPKLKHSSHSLADASYVLDLYKERGEDFPKYLNGLFSVAVYDEEKDRLVVTNDRYGFYPLFYCLNSERFVFASEAKAILKDPNVIPRLNKAAIPEFFTFSCLLGGKTFFENLEMLTPATSLVYDRTEDRITLKPYWDFAYLCGRDMESDSLSYLLKMFEKLMRRAVERSIADRREIGVFLSGGLDSRIISAFSSKTNASVVTFTFGARGCPQQRIAREVSDRLGIENVFLEIPSDFIAKYGQKIVQMGGGLVRIRDSHFISLLEDVRNRVTTVLLGTFGESLLGYNIKRRVPNLDSELAGYIFKNCIHGIPPSEYEDAFCGDLRYHAEQILKDSFLHIYSETFRNNSIRATIDRVDYWDYRAWISKHTYLPIQYIDWYLDTCHPYLDNELVDFFAFRLPAYLRFNRRFQRKAVNHCFPSLRDIPLEDSGTPPDSSDIRIAVGRGKRIAKERIRTTLYRLSKGKLMLEPTDYRDYAIWLRSGSKGYVESILLDSKALTKRYFGEEYVKRKVKEHMTAKKNHDRLLCDLVNFELMSRLYFETS